MIETGSMLSLLQHCFTQMTVINLRGMMRTFFDLLVLKKEDIKIQADRKSCRSVDYEMRHLVMP